MCRQRKKLSTIHWCSDHGRLVAEDGWCHNLAASDGKKRSLVSLLGPAGKMRKCPPPRSAASTTHAYIKILYTHNYRVVNLNPPFPPGVQIIIPQLDCYCCFFPRIFLLPVEQRCLRTTGLSAFFFWVGRAKASGGDFFYRNTSCNEFPFLWEKCVRFFFLPELIALLFFPCSLRRRRATLSFLWMQKHLLFSSLPASKAGDCLLVQESNLTHLGIYLTSRDYL